MNEQVRQSYKIQNLYKKRAEKVGKNLLPRNLEETGDVIEFMDIPTVYALMSCECHERLGVSDRVVGPFTSGERKKIIISERNSVVFFCRTVRRMRQKPVALQPPYPMMMNVLRWMEKICKNVWCS
jgi:hypothetical protein